MTVPRLAYSTGSGAGVPLMEEGWEPLPIGCGEVLRTGDDLLILAYGSMVNPALATAELLERSGQSATVVNARFLRPLDQSLIHPLCQRINRVVTMEEGAWPVASARLSSNRCPIRPSMWRCSAGYP